MELSFNLTLQNSKIFLQPQLQILHQIILANITSNITLIDNILQHIITSKSKQFRPILTLLSANLFNNINNNVISIAAAVEFIHTATLLHDDVIDSTKLRRGKQTANTIWGDKESILVGDFLFAKAFELMVSSNNIKVLELLANASATITKGEILQLQSINNINLTYNDYITIITSKTGALFAAACGSGAILNSNNNINSTNLQQFGNNLGIAFQIIDDLLDYYGQPSTGKNLGTDMLEQKITLPIILLLQHANSKEKEKITDIFTNNIYYMQFNLDNFNNIMAMLKKYNIQNLCNTIVNTFVQNSLKNIDSLINVKNIQSLEFLKLFAKSALNRTN